MSNLRFIAFSAFRFGSLGLLALREGNLIAHFRSPASAACFAARWGATPFDGGDWHLVRVRVGAAQALPCQRCAQISDLHGLLEALRYLSGELRYPTDQLISSSYTYP